MSGDDNARLLYALLATMLVASSLAARRLPLGQAVRMALIWVAIFGGIYVLFLFRGEGRELWSRVVADVSGDRGTVSGEGIRIRRNDDGHFWITAKLNGVDTRFMVDTGATISGISQRTAEAAGIALDGQPALVDTANGTVVMHRATADTLAVGSIVQRGAPLLVSGGDPDDTNVLGVSFLSRLKSWRVEGETLTLQP